jgi:asparagine synthase (glutamine-hydrolysing)
MLTWQGGKLTIEAYYHIPDAVPSVEKQRAHMREEVECMIDAAVKRQLVADVPVGIYLSGGIDSSIVTDSVMRQVGEASTFSIGFDLEKDEESAKFNADALLAEKTASHYGTRHYAYTLESKNIPELLEDLVWHMDEPVGNLTALAQRALATYARRDVTVVLGGDGGDELFGGYKRHSLAHKLRYYWMIPSPIRSLLPLRYRKANAESWTDRYLLFLAQKEPVMQSLLVTPDVYNRTYAYFHDTYFAHTTRNTFLDDMMRADLSSWLVDESLLRSDKMSMASGLEQRVPFLDPDVVSLARSIPAREKVTLSDTKKILKDAFRHRLPEYIFNQPKRGWIAPTAKWLRRSDVREYVTNVLSPSYYRETASLFHWQHIEQMYHDHREKKGYYLAPLWSVVMFQVWARRFKITIEQ